jgi:hypothetical protein
MDLTTTGRAVEDELAESFLEVSLHLEKLEPQHLCLDRDRMGAVQAGGESLIDQGIGLGAVR